MKSRIVAETEPLFRALPDTPPSVRQLMASLQAERQPAESTATTKEAGLTDEEKESLLKLRLADVDDVETLVKLGIVLSEQPDRQEEAEAAYRKALDAYSRALDIDPNNAFAWSIKGWTLLNLGRYEEALDAYSRALDINPNNALAWSIKGAALDELGRYEEALDAYSRALDIDPDNVSVLNSLAWDLYVLGDEKRLPEAEAFARRAVELNAETGAFQHTLAAILGAQDKWPEALECTTLFLQDTEMVAASLNEIIAFFIDAAAAGFAAEALACIEASPCAETLETMAVALRLFQDETVDVALEIREVAKDVVERIEARREARQQA